jgi:ankyrin repeat protein
VKINLPETWAERLELLVLAGLLIFCLVMTAVTLDQPFIPALGVVGLIAPIYLRWYHPYHSLHVAAREGRAERVTRLLHQGADPNARDLSGFTPLHLAVSWGHRSAVLALLEGKADPNIPSRAREWPGATPLHLAVAINRRDLIEDLLAAGANPTAQMDAGRPRCTWPS